MKITYSFYKYAPESANVTVNGEKIDISGTNIGLLFCTGSTNKAIEEIKRIYRKNLKEKPKKVYTFFAKGSKQFYYIPSLAFENNSNIKDRLYYYRETKNHFKNHPPKITVESGFFNPDGNNQPTKTEEIKIDFSHIHTRNIVFE